MILFVLPWLLACAPTPERIEHAPPEPVIFHGDPPDRPEHDAVVALLPRTRDGVHPVPFCSGVLAGERLVLTAAHCVEDLAAGSVLVYFGDEPTTDPRFSERLHAVEALKVHPGWDPARLTSDLAALRLRHAPDAHWPRIAPMPEEHGFGEADVGRLVDIAGFGFQEDGAYGSKRHVEVPIAGFGCASVGACGSLPHHPDTQVAYRQPGPPANGGPCNGDSGGPLFVARGDAVYVGGLTSYGSAHCEGFGVSTRLDAFADWLRDPFAPPSLPLESGLGFTLNEIHPDPVGPDTDQEWVEVLNLEDAPLSARGWALRDAAGHVVPLPDVVVAPGAALVVVGTLYLNNGAETLELLTPEGVRLESARWDATSEGVSLNRRVEGDWEAPFVPHPEVPGAVGSSSPGTRVDGTPW